MHGPRKMAGAGKQRGPEADNTEFRLKKRRRNQMTEYFSSQSPCQIK